MVIRTAKSWRWENLEKDCVELGALIKHFELYNKTEGKSPTTIDWYSMVLRQFHRFLLESEKSSRLGDLGEPEVREFILYLQEKNRWQDNPFILIALAFYRHWQIVRLKRSDGDSFLCQLTYLWPIGR